MCLALRPSLGFGQLIMNRMPIVRRPSAPVFPARLLLVLALAAACGDSGTSPPTPTSLTISPPSLTFEALGETARFTATVLDQNGQAISGVEVVWFSSDEEVATVDQDGLATAAGNGTADISAAAGSLQNSARVEVEQVPKSVRVSAPLDSLSVGDSVRMTAEAFDARDNPVAGAAFVWISSDSVAATVDQEGWVRAKAEGSVEITAVLRELRASASLVILPLSERNALIAFYKATNGPAWKDNTNWATTEPVSEWYGVEVDDEGQVALLLLDENYLTGSIPAEIGTLTALKRLHLAQNGLIGPIPPEIGELTRLEWLGLFSNSLEGPIPPEIGNLVRLRALDLAYNSMSGPIPPEIGRLANLEWLGLFGNDLTDAIPKEIEGLASLQVLDLCYNRLTGQIPPEIGSLASLESLALCGIDTDPDAGNRLTGSIPPEIGNLTKLRALKLGANRLTGPIPPEIGNLASLDTLSLYSNSLTGIPAEIGQLTNLRSMLLYGNRLTGPIPRTIGNLVNLESLLLGLGFTSGANGLTGPIPAEIGNLAKLNRLDLGGNRLTGAVPREIGNLAELEQLELGDNSLTGTIPAEIGNLANLTRLALCKNGLTGTIPPEVGRLTSLRYLYLCRNALTGLMPPEIGGLASLEQMHLESNSLTGELPFSIVSLDRLRLFFWGSNDGLCAPRTKAFEDWLAGIQTVHGDFCASASASAAADRVGEPGTGRCSVTTAAASASVAVIAPPRPGLSRTRGGAASPVVVETRGEPGRCPRRVN